MARFRHLDRHKVAIFVRHGLLPMELGIVHRIFSHARSADGERLYEVLTCALTPGEVRADADVTINVTHGPDLLDEADTVMVPAANELDNPQLTGRPGAALSGAFERVGPDTRVASICTGSFALAAVGRLDGRRATTHWKAVDQFRKLYPAVHLDPDVLYTDEGDVLTSAGDAAGIDLCLHLIRRDHGAAVANDVARATVVPAHRQGGQAQFISRPVPAPRSSSTQQAREWALRHLEESINLPDMAARESMSARTFSRRFRGEIGTSPARWLIDQRVERARQLLETSDLSIDQVALKAGFGTPTAMRQHLRTSLGVSPSQYRQTFRPSSEPTELGRPSHRQTA